MTVFQLDALLASWVPKEEKQKKNDYSSFKMFAAASQIPINQGKIE